MKHAATSCGRKESCCVADVTRRPNRSADMSPRRQPSDGIALQDMGRHRGQLGATTNSSKGPKRQALDCARRRREEDRWAPECGPLATRFICPICGEDDARADQPTA